MIMTLMTSGAGEDNLDDQTATLFLILMLKQSSFFQDLYRGMMRRL